MALTKNGVLTVTSKFTLYTANVVGREGNYLYPNRVEITDAESLKRAVQHDYVCAEYANSHRSSTNFIESDCVAMDCDNDHSEDDCIHPLRESISGDSHQPPRRHCPLQPRNQTEIIITP